MRIFKRQDYKKTLQFSSFTPRYRSVLISSAHNFHLEFYFALATVFAVYWQVTTGRLCLLSLWTLVHHRGIQSHIKWPPNYPITMHAAKNCLLVAVYMLATKHLVYVVNHMVSYKCKLVATNQCYSLYHFMLCVVASEWVIEICLTCVITSEFDFFKKSLQFLLSNQ